MDMEPYHLFAAIAVGTGASLIMDIWNLFLKRLFAIASLNYCLLGRWVCYIPEGTFRHTSIAKASKRKYECVVGWVAHYTIGVAFALVFLLIASRDWLNSPTLLPALLFGVSTVVFPLFVLQPSLGLGIASSRAPRPAQARVKSLMTHTVFGFGLYICALGIRYVLPGHS